MQATETEKDLQLINGYSRSELDERQVYIFPLTLCDNDIDRDYERFSEKALEQLSGLFVGKTGIFNHSMKAQDQNARIFKTWCERDKGRKTADGREYMRLCAKAYMVRTAQTESLIKQIDAGIKKEVSVGCSMASRVCSICNKDSNRHACGHIAGNTYDGKLCYFTLSEPSDAYEWSFVAVPSQRCAGITKSYSAQRHEQSGDVAWLIKSAGQQLVLNAAQIGELSKMLDSLDEARRELDLYRQRLLCSVKRYAALALSEMDTEVILSAAEQLDAPQLERLKAELYKKACTSLPIEPQLKKRTAAEDGRFDQFII